MKIQHRTALIFATLTISIVLLVSMVEYYFVNQNTFEDFYKRLEIRAIIAAKTEFEKAAMGTSAYEEIRKLHLETLPNEKEYIIPVDPTTNQPGSNPLKVDDNFFKEAISTGKARYRDNSIFYLAHLYGDDTSKYIVVISAKNEFIDAFLYNFRTTIIISIISTSLISLLIGLWFSNIVMKPIRSVTQKMQDISASQLHLRLPTPEIGRDEIANLAKTFNNMLDRLESAFETQKNFISNASHELNTPLTTIIGESEYALSKPRNMDEYAGSLHVILSEAERLRKITGSLLHLAQTGYNGKNQEFKQLRIDEVLFIVKENVDNIIPENNVYINLTLIPEDQTKLLVKGNQQLLELALANIVLNACKYSRNQPVQITLAASHQKVILIIEDHGIGIPKNEIAYIYEPFFRASNTGSFNGYGIGLPLSRNIIRMHNGELEVTSEENVGTKIKITLPLYVL